MRGVSRDNSGESREHSGESRVGNGEGQFDMVLCMTGTKDEYVMFAMQRLLASAVHIQVLQHLSELWLATNMSMVVCVLVSSCTVQH